MMARSRRRWTAAAMAGALVLAGCSSGGGDDGETLQLWGTENQPDRVAVVEEVLAAFTESSGIEVSYTPVAEDELPSLVVSGAASGDLPDLIYHPLGFTAGWTAEGILDPDAVAGVLESLGEDTFSPGALDLVRVDGQVAALPSDGWGQLLVYRKDLFDEAGLEAPDTYDAILAAARELHDPANDMYGITLSTDPSAVFTQQTFEHFALANGCQLVGDDQQVTLDTPNCQQAIAFFAQLANDVSPGGTQGVETTRATYFAGQAAMVVWSPFILDEMAALRDDAMPTCEQCAGNPGYLAENSGFVTAFTGPSGSQPAQYGQLSSLGITVDADTEAAATFAEYWFGEGYEPLLGIAPEGKIPMRQGTAEDDTAYIEAWQTLETGVDTKAPLSDFYSQEVVDGLVTGSDGFGRWGFGQGAGVLVSSVYESLEVPSILNDVISGDLDAAAAASELQAAVEDMAE